MSATDDSRHAMHVRSECSRTWFHDGPCAPSALWATTGEAAAQPREADPAEPAGLDRAAKSLIRGAISDAYYESRNDGQTMEHAASDAARRVLEVLEGYGIRLALTPDPEDQPEKPHRPVDQPVKSRHQHVPDRAICEDCGHEWRAACHSEDQRDGLDAAWKAAEAALPEGWSFETGNAQVNSSGRYAVTVYSLSEYQFSTYGPTPAAALQALAARLSEPKKETP